MSARRRRHHLAAALVALLSVALLIAAWYLRPALPRLSGSLTTPLTASELEGVLVFACWAVIAGLLIAAVVRATRELTRRDGNAEPPAPTSARTAPRPIPTPAAAGPPYSPPLRLTVSAPATTLDRASAPARETGGRPAVAEGGQRDEPTIHVSLLGPFDIHGLERNATLRSASEQLLAYLALHPRGATRDELIEAIWPGQDPRSGRQRLWQNISELRALLGDTLVADRGHYALDRGRIAVDVDELERLMAEADTSDVPRAQRPALERALRLFRGEPLAGWDYLWADPDVRRLRSTHAELLERAGHARLATGDPHGALEAAEHGLKLDSLNENLWRLAMQAENRLGLRQSVGRRYERLRRHLDKQLGLEPEAATRTLYHELLGQR